MAMVFIFPPGIYPKFYPVGKEGERPSHLTTFTSKPFTFAHRCHKQLGLSYNSLGNTFLLVKKQGSHFPCCLVKALSEVKHKAPFIAASQECAYLIQAWFSAGSLTKKGMSTARSENLTDTEVGLTLV